jgi:hypothetical protein
MFAFCFACSLHSWTDGMAIEKSDQHAAANGKTVKTLLQLTKEYSKWLTEEETKTVDELVLMNVRTHVLSDLCLLLGGLFVCVGILSLRHHTVFFVNVFILF